MLNSCGLSSMVVNGGSGDQCEWGGRWDHVKKFLERPGPFTHPDFEPSTEVRKCLTLMDILNRYYI